jgi:hypothetical protein
MANRFWVGGTANWDNTAGTKWSATSGGAGGVSVPTSVDDVFFNASSGSGTVTISGTVNARILIFSGFTGTVQGVSLANITLAGLTGQNTLIVPNTTTVGSGISITFTSNQQKFIRYGSTTQIEKITIPSFTGAVRFETDFYVKQIAAGDFNHIITCTSPAKVFVTESVLIDASNMGGLVVYATGGGTVTAAFTSSDITSVQELNVVTPTTLTLSTGIFSQNKINSLVFSGSSGTGTFNSNNRSIQIQSIIADQDCVLNMGTSSVTFGGGSAGSYFMYAAPGKSFTYNGSNSSTTIVSSNQIRTIETNSTVNLGNLNITAINTLNLLDDIIINSFTSNLSSISSATINYSKTITTTNFAAVNNFTNGVIYLSGNASYNPNIIQTSGTVQANNLQLTNSKAGGGATFIANSSGDLGGNSGWLFLNSTVRPRAATAMGRVGTVTVAIFRNAIIDVAGVSTTGLLGTAVLPNIFINVSGVTCTAIVGEVLIPIVPNGVFGTGQIGNATTDAIFSVSGVEATGVIGSVALWFNINTVQTSNWITINNLQT